MVICGNLTTYGHFSLYVFSIEALKNIFNSFIASKMMASISIKHF